MRDEHEHHHSARYVEARDRLRTALATYMPEQAREAERELTDAVQTTRAAVDDVKLAMLAAGLLARDPNRNLPR